jgi:sugar phosphate isomerase/epimerase
VTAAEAAEQQLQLYSLRDDVGDLGIQRVLEIVAQMGYTNIETAGYFNGMIYGMSPSEFRRRVEDLGMRATSAHVMHVLTDDYDADIAWWNRATAAHAEAGFKYMVMPWAPFEGEGATLDNVKRYASYFSNIGMITSAASISFGYHNHEFEFTEKINGVPLYDVLIEEMNTRVVHMQNDVYWTNVGGYDPVEYLKKYPQIIRTLHIKDDNVIGASGKLDFKAIFEQFYANGHRDWYVEVEQYAGTPQEDVKKSFDFLMAADFVR